MIGKKSNKKNKEKEDDQTRLEEIKPTRFCNIFEYLMDLLPKKIICCNKNRSQRMIEKARQDMEQEINIVEIIKSRRYINEALR